MIVDIGVPFSDAEVIARDDLVNEGIVEEEQELEELPDEIPWYEAVDEGVGGVDDAECVGTMFFFNSLKVQFNR
jgi:hypothetical protein